MTVASIPIVGLKQSLVGDHIPSQRLGEDLGVALVVVEVLAGEG